jgi:hypothetical protein
MRRLVIPLLVYVVAIVAANVLTDRYGLVPAGFGLTVTAGTYAAGFALLARDFVQRVAGIGVVLVAILVGAILSLVLANPAIALASATAFLAAELADLVVYTPAISRVGFTVAALVSNIVAAPIDTVAFLWLAGFPVTLDAVVGQFVAKILWATLVPLVVYGIARALPRQPLNS